MDERAETTEELTRRGVIYGGAAAMTAALGGAALAQDAGHDGHGDHAAHGADIDAGPHHEAIVEAALHCVNKGDACLAHCIALMGAGDASLAPCAQSVAAMTPVMQTLAKLAAADAPRLKIYALVAIDFCKDCASECRKHAEHHAACKACLEACAASIKATGELVAS